MEKRPVNPLYRYFVQNATKIELNCREKDSPQPAIIID